MERKKNGIKKIAMVKGREREFKGRARQQRGESHDRGERTMVEGNA
jgi:hypothetical protein